MQLELSKKEFRRLLDMVYIGNWILNSTRGEDRFRDYDQVESLLFEKARQEGMPIRSLEVFLLYLPLFHPYLLADVMGRLGGTPRRNHYLAENLKFLYDHIPDSPAKQYADWYRYYKLEPPTVDTVTDGSRTPEKLEKLEAWVQLQETPEYGAAYDDYRARLTSFQSRFLSGAEQAALLGEDGKW